MGKKAAIMAKLKMPAPMMGMIQCTDARADQPYQLGRGLGGMSVKRFGDVQEADGSKEACNDKGWHTHLRLRNTTVLLHKLYCHIRLRPYNAIGEMSITIREVRNITYPEIHFIRHDCPECRRNCEPNPGT